MKRTLAAVLTLTVSSCSFVFTRSPGDVGKPPQKLADCKEGRGFPIADAIIGGVFLASALGIFNSYDPDTGESSSPDTAVTVTGLLIAGAFGVSSVFGFTRTSKCRASHAEYFAAHPRTNLGPIATIPVGANGGMCTPQLSCDAGLVCSGMPDGSNKCIVAPQAAQTVPTQPAGPEIPVGMQGGACTPQLTCVLGLVCAGMPDHTNKCMPAQGTYLPPEAGPPKVAPPPAAPAVGAQNGACTPQLTCNQGLVCAGMPDRTNKCVVGQIAAPAVGAQGGACTPQLTCNQGLVCSGMPDRTNKCIVAPATAAPAVGAQGGACTPQLTCNQGLVCSGMPDRTNKCIVAPAGAVPAVGAQGGACTPQLTCNQGLVCSGMPDRTNKCIVAPR